MFDAACSGSILNLTPDAAMERFQEMSESTRSFGKTYQRKAVNVVTPAGPSPVLTELAELKEMVKIMANQNVPQ